MHCSNTYSSHCSSGYFVSETFDSGVNLELGDLSQLYLSVHADIIPHRSGWNYWGLKCQQKCQKLQLTDTS